MSMRQLTSLRLFPFLSQQQQLTRHAGRLHCQIEVPRMFATEASQQQEGTSWMPSWLKARLPETLGGAKEPASEELDLDKYAGTLRQARRMGSVANLIPGVARASATESLHLYESIISAMQPQEKQQLQSFNASARHRVAQHVKCNVSQVDDCIAKYLYMKSMTGKVKQLKDEGKPMPKDYQQLEREFGNWQSFRTATPDNLVDTKSAPAGSEKVPSDAKSPKGYPCPWAGQSVGRSTKCPATKKSFKACCGKTYRIS